ncbi:hypothetical protein [Leptospira interrogans]|uniref:hypothetical protein n=1 Tax=Leptospira interrogans TaxID=173 RepID=UPI0012B5D49A|nr:hypothetical protein [Leptospira interrogans]
MERNLKKILLFLLEAKKAGMIICPVSGVLLEEVGKQTDLFTRSEMSKLMDELSDGIGLANQFTVYSLEVYLLINQTELNKISTDIPNPNHYVWRRGMHRKLDAHFSPDNKIENLLGSYLALANVSTMECLGEGHRPGDELWQVYQELAQQSFKEKNENRSSYKSFRQLIEIELIGHLKAILERYPEILPSDKFIPYFFERPNEFLKNGIPASYTYASVMAAYRHDLNRKYAANDFFDAEHVAMGLGYHDLLITERELFSIVTNTLKKHDERLDSKIIFKSEDVIPAIESLLQKKIKIL